MAKRRSRQEKIISNYYRNRDEIMLQKLGEIVSELCLAESEGRRNQLWQRAEKALRNLDAPEVEVARIVDSRSPETLAKFLTRAF